MNQQGEEKLLQTSGKIMWIVFLSGLVSALNTGTLYIAYLDLAEHFHSDLSTTQWLTIMYSLTSAMITPVAGYFSKRYSLRKALITALIIMIVASACCTLAVNMQMLIGCRAIQGIAGGLMMPLSLAIIYQWIPKEKQGRFLSISLMGMSMGPAIGPTLSGLFLATVGWQAIFLCNVPITLVDLYLVYRIIPKENSCKDDLLDYKSILTVFCGTMFILLSFYQAGKTGWQRPTLWLGLILGCVLLYVFVRGQLKAQEKALLDFRIFRNQKFTVSVILSAILYANITLGAFLLPVFLESAMGMEPLPAGMVLFFPALCMALATPVAGRVYEKLSARTQLIGGLNVMILGNVLVTTFKQDTALWMIVMFLCVRYIGAAFANVPSLDYGLGALPKNKASEGTAMNNWIKSMAISMSLSIFTAIYALEERQHIAELLRQGIVQSAAVAQTAVIVNSHLFWLQAGTLLLGLLLIVATTEKKKA